jgi:hypothetical protein
VECGQWDSPWGFIYKIWNPKKTTELLKKGFERYASMCKFMQNVRQKSTMTNRPCFQIKHPEVSFAD